MKKGLLLILLFLSMLTIACSPIISSDEDNDSGSFEEGKVLGIDDYYPYLENTILDYQGIGIEFAEQVSYFEFIGEERAQLKIENPGTHIVKLLEKKDGSLSQIVSEGEFYHIENLLDREASSLDILLKEPLEVGNSWETIDGDKREITGLDVDIETPYKLFKALEVTVEKDSGRVKDYYAEGIGLVASIYEEGDIEVKTLLRDIKEEAKKLSIRKYYPWDIDSNIVYLDGEISFRTNDIIEEKLEEILKDPPSKDLIPVISSGTKINSINLDRDNWILRVDFSPDLIDDMNYGSAMEIQVLDALVSTLGGFYDVDKVSITVDGKAYESGHFYFPEDEYLEVKLEGLEEFKID